MTDKIQEWRCKYFDLGRELGEVINEQQDIILGLQRQVKSLKRENFNLRKTKRRK